jgi:2'-5' RNA ligase
MRLFIAIDFEGLKKDLTKLQDIDKFANIKKTDTFHLTLKFLGKVSEENAEEVKQKLKQIKFTPFALTLNKIGTFPSESYIRVVWIDVKPEGNLMVLQKEIEDALPGFKKDFKFHPHVTLARVKQVTDKEKFIEALKNFKVEEKSIEVKNFKLIKSTLTPKGPIYEDLETYT